MGRPTEILSRWQIKYLRAADPQGRARRFYHNHPDRRPHLVNPEGEKTRLKGIHQRKRAEAIEALGGARCVGCGYDADPRALQIDHIDGGNGRADRARFKNSSYNFYRHVIQAGCDKFQVLCANCNIIKKVVNREFGKKVL